MAIVWTPYDTVTPDAQAWPIGNGKLMTQYSAGGYNAGNPNAGGVVGHNQILSALDYYWNTWLSPFGYGSSSGVAQAVSGNKQSPGALVAGIQAFYTNLGKAAATFGNHSPGQRAARLLIKQMRAALDNAAAPNSGLGNVYGGYVSRVWNGSGVPTDGYTSSGGNCVMIYTNGHKGGTIHRLWMPINVSSLAGWTGPLWYKINSVGLPGPGTYSCDWYVQDGAPTPAFSNSQAGTMVASNIDLSYGFSPIVYIPLGIYPTIGSSGTITVCANFENDLTLVPGTVTTGTSINKTQTLNSAASAYYS